MTSPKFPPAQTFQHRDVGEMIDSWQLQVDCQVSKLLKVAALISDAYILLHFIECMKY